MADISYTPTTWADGSEGGTPIDAAKLNNMETGISDAVAAIGPNDTTADGTLKAQIDALGESVLHFRTYTIDSFAITSSNRTPQLNISLPNIASVSTVTVVKYGTNNNYDNQMHLYSYSYDNEVLVVRFVGDNDTYMGVVLGIFYTD